MLRIRGTAPWIISVTTRDR